MSEQEQNSKSQMIGPNTEGRRLDKGLQQNAVEEVCGTLGAVAWELRDGIEQWSGKTNRCGN